jgi:hypothetical protein
MVLSKKIIFFLYLVSSKDVEIHEVVEKVSMESPIKIEQSLSPWLALTFRHDNIELIF